MSIGMSIDLPLIPRQTRCLLPTQGDQPSCLRLSHPMGGEGTWAEALVVAMGPSAVQWRTWRLRWGYWCGVAPEMLPMDGWKGEQ